MPADVTIAEAALRCGLPESTLRYWERIGLLEPVRRDSSSGHRRYGPTDVELLETLANLRAVGLSVDDMRTYLSQHRRGDDAAGEQRALFQAHERRVSEQLDVLQLRRTYLELKVRYWTAREAGDEAAAAAVAAELRPIIKKINPKEHTS